MNDERTFTPPHAPDLGIKLKWLDRMGYSIEVSWASLNAWTKRKPLQTEEAYASPNVKYRVRKP